MKTSNLLILCTLVCAGSAFAQADDASLYPVNTTVRDYAKRDRVMLGSLQYVSPSQHHEDEGFRFRVEGESSISELKRQGVESDLETPMVSVGATYGWQSLTLGIQASQTLAAEHEPGVSNWDGEDAEEASEAVAISGFKEDFDSRRITPEVAYTFGKYFTAGVGVEMNTLQVEERATAREEYKYDYQRVIAGLSYHQPEYEVGVAFTSEVQEQDSRAPGALDQPSLSLAQYTPSNERAIYLPNMGTAFVRGNVSDNVSLMTAVSMSRYDGNVDGAVNLFEEYKSADRMAGRLVGTYWTDNRSRISLGAEYKGAATSAINDVEHGLGYRLANLYGGSLEGVLSINRAAYIGISGQYLRGERGDTKDDNGARYTASEETQRYAGFVTVKL